MQTFVLQIQRVKKVVLKHQKIVSMPLNFKNIFSLHKGPQERGSFFYVKEKKTDDIAEGDPLWMMHF